MSLVSAASEQLLIQLDEVLTASDEPDIDFDSAVSDEDIILFFCGRLTSIQDLLIENRQIISETNHYNLLSRLYCTIRLCNRIAFIIASIEDNEINYQVEMLDFVSTFDDIFRIVCDKLMEIQEDSESSHSD